MARSRITLSEDVVAELPLRLLNSAEAFYYAGVLCSSKFDPEKVGAGVYRSAQSAAEAAISGENRNGDLGSPPIVNFGFAIELFIKLLRYMACGQLMTGHNLHQLFLQLEKEHPDIANKVIEKHFYWRGNRVEFIEDIESLANVFEEWRYAYEKPFLFSSADSLMVLADAFRTTVGEQHPDLRSAFRDLKPTFRTPAS